MRYLFARAAAVDALLICGLRITYVQTFLGLGPTPILIPEEMVERKPDRVEIIMTASEETFVTRHRELKAKR